MADLSGMSVQELRFRQTLGRGILKELRAAERAGEEGATAAVAKYEGQFQEITAELKKRLREAREASGTEKPPPVEIGLKTARMGARGR